MNHCTQRLDKQPPMARKLSRYHHNKIRTTRNVNSPVHQVMFLQMTSGNKAVQKMIQSGYLQAKFRIGRPGDKYEQEADRIADTVMQMNVAPSVSSNSLSIQRACPACEEEELQRQPLEEEEELQRQPLEEEEELQRQPLEEEEELQRQSFEGEEELQRQSFDNTSMQTTAQRRNTMQVHSIQSIPPPEEEMLQARSNGKCPFVDSPEIPLQLSGLRSGGQQLPASVRSYFEPRFGYDFGKVRVHYNGQASHAARSIHARAFTMGTNVVFGSGEYSPQTGIGKKLLAHELTHVIQQNSARAISQQKYGSDNSLEVQRVKSDHEFLQKWSIGAPAPGINTIVCDGSDGTKVQAGATGNAQQTKCLKHCIVQHENSHIADARAENATICKSEPSGKTVRPDNGEQRNKTEIKASNVEINCLNNKLPKASSTCKTIIKARITQMEGYRDSFK